MDTPEPQTDVDRRYGEPDATPTPWSDARTTLVAAELSWLTTVRPDGRPHVTPLLTVLAGDTLHVCTGPEERKAHNLAENPHVVLTTGRNDLHAGIDLVVQGRAVRVVDPTRLHELAEAWVGKYGEEWRFDVGPDGFRHPGSGGDAWVFAVEPTTAFGFGKDPYSQTRWRFGRT